MCFRIFNQRIYGSNRSKFTGFNCSLWNINENWRNFQEIAKNIPGDQKLGENINEPATFVGDKKNDLIIKHIQPKRPPIFVASSGTITSVGGNGRANIFAGRIHQGNINGNHHRNGNVNYGQKFWSVQSSVISLRNERKNTYSSMNVCKWYNLLFENKCRYSCGKIITNDVDNRLKR